MIFSIDVFSSAKNGVTSGGILARLALNSTARTRGYVNGMQS
ncbi:Hypothetical protein CpCap5W_0589 [Corynebacterium pseudotuberculosis]|nr:Hypothetical protein Cp3995_0566 [Corynebacterium pseudotuberculosis 3/99-5]ATQ64888.1 Hypothetical protein CpPA07_0574 [Corynebacterium pseudotuberculosis]AZN19448.1 hypothetical protein CpCap1W_0586 [Corynebacterium pseudotuberculosis]AZN21549.1 Hypothetical protein CpOviAF1_0584 [Corynebacterium pseudotuberculosis]QBB90585.1 hypothetical protein CpCR07_0589 [Corynebacterium pseudotuberculosis]